MNTHRLTLALYGIGFAVIGAAPLAPYVRLHLADPAVRVLSDGTLTTYLTEIFVETDAVGPAATLLAWCGVALVVAAVAWPHLDPLRAGEREEVPTDG